MDMMSKATILEDEYDEYMAKEGILFKDKKERK